MSVVNAVPLLLADDGYQISRSVRLRSSATAYFNRTFGTPTSGNIFTWSGWVKRGAIGAVQPLFLPSLASGEGAAFTAAGNLNISVNGAWLLVSSAVYRDPSAWYHIMLVSDMGNATASLRFRVYVNGSEVTAWSTDARASYTSFPYWNKNTVVHYMGYSNAYPAYADGYMTEVNFIDGQALTPSSFGESNSTTGVWQPKKYTGTYGTNGFYLNFSDNSNNTAATIGKDYSGNGNNWTPNNISVTAGATYDSMLDVPTQWADGGNGRGNYCTLNPLRSGASFLQNGNLSIVNLNTGAISIYGSMYSADWYAEVTAASLTGVGVVYIGVELENGSAYSYVSDGTKQSPGGNAAYSGNSYTTGDVIGIAYSAAGVITFYKNGVSQGSAFTGLSGAGTGFLASGSLTARTFNANFGQRPFAYTPPSGFKALNTLNLPAPTISNGASYFATTLWTGDGATSRTISTAVNGVSFQPDLVWVKARNNAREHILEDSVRGLSYDKQLSSNTTGAEASNPGAGGVTGADATTITLGGTGTMDNVNRSTWTYVGWQWKEGATQGFDIVTYTGNGTARTIAHSLGVAPNMVIVKSRTSALFWRVYHAALGATRNVQLNTTNAFETLSTIWNDTAPTSSVFSVGTNNDVNANAGNYVAYLFAEVAGFSRFGSYTGNGSSDGPFVFCGFRPRFVMIKGSSFTSNWFIQDGARNGYNVNTGVALRPNLSNAEDGTTFYDMDLLSNGFKLRTSTGDSNSSGATFIFAAFAENPFKNSLAR